MPTDPYLQLTELAGSLISEEQLQRMFNRYSWAQSRCAGLRVLEAACGSGQGLRLLSSAAASTTAGDYSASMLAYVRRAAQVPLLRFDAQRLPFADNCFDVVILFEALYYVPSPDLFFAEAARVLCEGGTLLLATANRDLFDFNPSPHSHEYLGVEQMAQRLAPHGFRTQMFGDLPVTEVSTRQRLLRPLKAAAVRMGLFPQTADSKVWLKRIVFGRMRAMPEALDSDMLTARAPTPIDSDKPDRRHKVILCEATKLRRQHGSADDAR